MWHPSASNRRGLILPLVIVAVTILFILIFALSRSTTETHRLGAIINHRNHTIFMAMGAMEEMHDVLWNLVSNPLEAQKREDVLEAVYGGGGEYEMDLLPELKYAHKQDFKQKKGVSKGEESQVGILEASVTFHDFTPMRFSSAGLYSDPTPYYTSPDGVGGVPAEGRDFVGFVTYKVVAQHGIIKKTIRQSRPVKIVDMTPMGKEYVVFEMDSGNGKSLNDGPPFFIYGNNDGRIRMNGPYYLDVGGISNGLSSEGGFFSFGADELPSGLKTSISYNEAEKWYDQAKVPSPKWLKGCAWVNGGRTSSSTIVGASFYSCCPLIPLPLGDAMGLYAEPKQQSYLSGKIPYQEQNFSLTGNPMAGAFSPFKGLMYSSGGAIEEAQGVAEAEDWQDLEKEMEIRHEGVIVGNYKSWKLQKMCVCLPPVYYVVLCIHGGSISEGGPIQDYYALKGDEEPEVNWAMTVLGAAMDVAGSFAGGQLQNAANVTAGLGQVMKSVGGQLTRQFMTGSLGGDNLGADGVQQPEDIPNAFPSGFRSIPRAAVRHFSTMDEAIWKGDRLLLDGVYWVDDLSTKKDIKYIGKGYLAALGTDTMGGEPVIRSFKPKNPDEDALSIWYASNMPVPLKVETDDLVASVFSLPGLDPQETLRLKGNYMTSTIIKDQLTAGMHVMYDNDRLAKESPEDYKNYITISISPKIEAFGTVDIRNPLGTGDDGVVNVVESL